MDEVERRQRSYLADLDGDPAEIAWRLWEQVSSHELRPFVRLFLGLYARLTAAGPSRRAEALVSAWVHPALLVVDVPPEVLRLGLAVTRGLLLDLIATGRW